jgi:ankyrin repeat protein
MRIIDERPDYRLFENNCQNFVKFLLEHLCPESPIPDTIQNVLQRLQDISQIDPAQDLSLPGAYPTSNASTESASFVTASGRTWISASGTTWVTAAESIASADSSFAPSNLSTVATRLQVRVPQTAVHHAVRTGNENTVLALLKYGPDLSVRERGKTAVQLAVSLGHQNIVRILLEANPDHWLLVPRRGQTLQFPLHYSVASDDFKTVKILLETGANVSATDRYGWTPLHYLSFFDPLRFQWSNLLTSHSSDLHPFLTRLNRGCPQLPYSLAIAFFVFRSTEKSLDILALLLKGGADTTLKLAYGETPLHLAAAAGRDLILRALLDARADPTVVSEEGNTPLHYAVAGFNNPNDTTNAIKALLAADSGSGTTLVRNLEGRTALDLVDLRIAESRAEVLRLFDGNQLS